MAQVYIGRQPIFDRDNRVFAYELLWRGGQDNRAGFADGDLATTQVMLNALTEIGLDRLVGEHRAFINLTRRFLLEDQPLPEMTDQVVLEILEDIEPDEQVIAAVRRLAGLGYSIALDDFLYRPELEPLVELADVVKIDLLALDDAALREHVAQLRRHPLRLLAEKVENAEQHALCMELGFDYFQGYYYARPNVVKGRRMPANQLALLQLLAALRDPDVSDTELENLIGQDVSLAWRLLRYINSARFGLSREIDSIRQAIALLGRQNVIRIASLLLMAKIGDKPPELMMTALIRAHMARRLCGDCDPDTCYTAGLFSVLDALLDRPMAELLEELPLSEDLSRALRDRTGPVGDVLATVIAYDEADWDRVSASGFDPEPLSSAYVDAIDEASETAGLIG